MISALDFDTASDNYSGSQSTIIVDQAIVNRLEALEAFKSVRAPFDGIVTARNTDIGAFVPSGSGTTQLFRMARNSPLRVYVVVPQALSSFVKVGGEAELAVRFNGTRSTMLVVQKTGSASTLDIVQGIKDKIPKLKLTLPPELDISLLSDQSIFVTGAIDDVVQETVIAGCLTAIMILLFLGDWKSTLIIAISIPLAILSSIAVLSALGQTLNIMTLGGLALAVGILVDDATVTIENIDRHLAEGKPVLDAIRDGAAQIAVPALVSTMCICIVFIPIFFLSGVAKYLFSPLAEAVIFAMISSYILSRTLVPTLAMYWITKNGEESLQAIGRKTFTPFTWFSRFHLWFDNRFDKFREGYRDLLSFGLRNAGKLITLVLGFTVVSMGLFPFLGQNFFPAVDAGQFDMHVRVKSGTRIEETARSIDQIEQMIRQVIRANQLHGIVDNLGLPYSGINTSYNTTGTMSPADGDILVSLNGNHYPTDKFVQIIRTRMQHDFPDAAVWFPPADIVAQTLNFGLSAPIDIQITGQAKAANFAFASKLMDQIRHIPGAVDFRIQDYRRDVVVVNDRRCRAA